MRLAPVMAVALALSAAAAGAQPAADATVAEALFRHGRQLLAEGKVSEACEKLAASQRLDPGLGTLLNLADCHEREGRPATAWSEFSEAAYWGERQHDDRATFARGRLRALEKVLERVVVRVREPADGLTVSIDGRPLGREAWGTPIPVDPGARTVEGRAPGRRAWRTTLEVPRGPGVLSLEVPALEPQPVAVAPLPRLEEAAAPPPAPAPAGVDRRRLAGWALAGVAVAGVAAGTVLGLSAKGKLDDSRPHCPGDVCDAEGFALDRQARHAALASTIGFGVGLAAAAGAASLLVVVPRLTRAAAAPWLVAGGGGVAIGSPF